MASDSRARVALAGLGAAAVAGGVLLERRHLQRVAGDAMADFLDHPPVGTPRRTRSADGTELYFEVFGSEDKPTIVLAHGWTEALRYWALVIRELAPHFRLVAYDQRGHGRSAPAVEDDYTLDRFGEDLEAVLQATVPDGQRAIVAGHSLGGMSVAAWAGRHDPARVRGAALLFTGLGDLVAETVIVSLGRLAHRLRDPIARRVFLGSRLALPSFSSPVSHALIRYVAFGPEASPAVVAFYERMLVQCAPEVRAAVGLAMADMNLWQALNRLTVPTLVVAGGRDRLTPHTHARRIASELPNLHELIVLPEIGHMGPLERPVEVARALENLSRAAHERPGRPEHVPAGAGAHVRRPSS